MTPEDMKKIQNELANMLRDHSAVTVIDEPEFKPPEFPGIVVQLHTYPDYDLWLEIQPL